MKSYETLGFGPASPAARPAKNILSNMPGGCDKAAAGNEGGSTARAKTLSRINAGRFLKTWLIFGDYTAGSVN